MWWPGGWFRIRTASFLAFPYAKLQTLPSNTQTDLQPPPLHSPLARVRVGALVDLPAPALGKRIHLVDHGGVWHLADPCVAQLLAVQVLEPLKLNTLSIRTAEGDPTLQRATPPPHQPDI